MIVERFKKDRIKELYDRFDKEGRLLPDGVIYIDSWIDENVETCFQLMESESLDLIHEWIEKWNNLADFEIVPVISSVEAKRKALGN